MGKQLTIKNIEKLWNAWMGSEEMLLKDMKRPVNFLGSQQEYKNKFLFFAENYLKEDLTYTYKIVECDYTEVYVNGCYLCTLIGTKEPEGITLTNRDKDVIMNQSNGDYGIIYKYDISNEAWEIIKPHLLKG